MLSELVSRRGGGEARGGSRLSVCLFVRLFACLTACVAVCLPVCPSCLPVCLPPFPACLSVLPAYLPACLSVSVCMVLSMYHSCSLLSFPMPVDVCVPFSGAGRNGVISSIR